MTCSIVWSRSSIPDASPLSVSSTGRYAFGLLLCAACLSTILLASLRLRSRILSGRGGTEARVAEILFTLALLTVALELTGVLGAFTRVGVVLGCVVIGAAGWLAAGMVPVLRGAAGADPEPHPHSSAPVRWLAVLALALVGGAWSGWTIYSLGHGVGRVDSLWYHLPTAARFVQTASIVHLQYFDADSVTAFYPAGAELFHAWGLLLFGSDLLSPLLNLGWGALALAAASAIGRPHGRSPHCMIAVALVLGGPGLIDTQPGSAYNDVACVALLLCAVTMLARGITVRSSVPASLAGGLALGTKFTMIVPVLALGAGAVLIAVPGTRTRQALIWTFGLLGLGGIWYLRNLILVGNPLPSLSLHLGPLSLPSPHSETRNYTVAQYLTDGHVWRAFLLPGLRRSLGTGWPALLALGCAGAVFGLLGTNRLRGPGQLMRMLGLVAVISGAAFLISPQALGLPGAPLFFAFNVRYAAPALALSLILLALLPVRRAGRPAAVALLLAGALVVLTELDPGIWPVALALRPFDQPLRGSSALLGGLIGLGLAGFGVLRFVSARRSSSGGLGGGAVPLRLAMGGAALICGGAIAHGYATKRFRNTPPLPRLYAWAQHVHGSRIGLVGFTEQYPLSGADSSNYVQYLGKPQPHRGFAAIRSCRRWRVAVNRGRYRWVVVAPVGFPLGAGIGQEVAWSRFRAPVTETLEERRAGLLTAQRVVLLRIDGILDPAGCPSGT